MAGDEFDSSSPERPHKDKSTEDLFALEVDGVHEYMGRGEWDVQRELTFRLLGRHPMMDESGEDPAYWAAVSLVQMRILALATSQQVHVADKDKIRDFFTGEVLDE